MLAHPRTPAYAPEAFSRPAARGANRTLALAAAALMLGWFVYAAPPARRAALAALRPLIGAVLPEAPALDFADVHARRVEINGQTVLYVEGLLVNGAKSRRKTPLLLVTIVGDDGQPLYAWKTKAARPEIEAAGGVSFQARLLSPPEKFQGIAVSFAKGG